MGYGSGLPFAVAGFSREPSAGNIVAAPPRALNCKKLLRPRTENDLEGNRYIANLLTRGSQSTQQDSTPKALYSVAERPSCKYRHGLPTQTVCNSLDSLLWVRDTDFIWIVGLRLETKVGKIQDVTEIPCSPS